MVCAADVRPARLRRCSIARITRWCGHSGLGMGTRWRATTASRARATPSRSLVDGGSAWRGRGRWRCRWCGCRWAVMCRRRHVSATSTTSRTVGAWFEWRRARTWTRSRSRTRWAILTPLGRLLVKRPGARSRSVAPVVATAAVLVALRATVTRRGTSRSQASLGSIVLLSSREYLIRLLIRGHGRRHVALVRVAVANSIRVLVDRMIERREAVEICLLQMLLLLLLLELELLLMLVLLLLLLLLIVKEGGLLLQLHLVLLLLLVLVGIGEQAFFKLVLERQKYRNRLRRRRRAILWQYTRLTIKNNFKETNKKWAKRNKCSCFVLCFVFCCCRDFRII